MRFLWCYCCRCYRQLSIYYIAMTVLSKAQYAAQHMRILTENEEQNYDGCILDWLRSTRPERVRRRVEARWKLVEQHRAGVREQ